jgi:broad specificity phosphatase PhoE
VWNASKRFQGRSDIKLSDEGRAQAQALAGVLRSESFDRAYASDLSRAQETARYIADPRGLHVETDVRLREFDFGAWEGLTWDEIVKRWPHLRDIGWTDAKAYEPEGGEHFTAVCARVEAFLRDVRGSGAERVLVVTHAGVLHAVLAVLADALGETREEALGRAFSPASITRIAMEGDRARLITVNDVAHLDSSA